MSVRPAEQDLGKDCSEASRDSPGDINPDSALGNAPGLPDMLKNLARPKAEPSDAVVRDSAEPEASTEGSECKIRTLYEGHSKCPCCINWVEQYPDDLRMELEQQEQTKQKALVVRMRKNHNEGKALVLDSVLVQSKSLKTTLSRVFEGYEGITPSLKKLVFRSPFRPFYYRWENFTNILEEQRRNDPDAALYTQLLYNVIDAELRDMRAEIDDLVSNGVITYELLWSLFETGVRVLSKVGPHVQFFLVQGCGLNKNRVFEVDAKYVDWDGQRFGYASGTLLISPFAGTRHISRLEVYPARFHPSLQDVELTAMARGRRFRDLSGFHHTAYSGTVTYKNFMGRREACSVSTNT